MLREARENIIGNEATGFPTIEITNEEERLSVYIETERLNLCSIEKKDLDNYYTHLFGNKEVMAKMVRGVPLSLEQTTSWVMEWVQRWEDRCPYSVFTVNKKDEDIFVGEVGAIDYYNSLTSKIEPGVSEIIYSFTVPTWRQGYATEASIAVVNHYLPRIKEGGAGISHLIEGEPLKEIVATARTDNPGSQKILRDKLKFVEKLELEKFGAQRTLFSKMI